VNTGGQKIHYAPATCIGSPESQLYPGTHKKKQVKGGDSPPLLGGLSHKTPPGVLHQALGSPEQEINESAGVSPEKGHKNDQRDGTPLL